MNSNVSNEVVTIKNITGKTSKRFGKVHAAPVADGQHADVVPGVSIRLYGAHQGSTYDMSFRIGDIAEYDSYNLHYTGVITSITTKTVTIEESRGSLQAAKKHRLDLYEFNWRNRYFDAEEIAARNLEISYHI